MSDLQLYQEIAPDVVKGESHLSLLTEDYMKRHGLTIQELKLFLIRCHALGANPLCNDAFPLTFKDKKKGTRTLNIIVSIDFLRRYASRHGDYAGSDDYAFDEGLTQFQHVQLNRGYPKTASCTVYRLVQGHKVKFAATVQWESHAKTGNEAFMWKRMPYHMLGKCAEAAAIRKAYGIPSLYIQEEAWSPFKGAPDEQYSDELQASIEDVSSDSTYTVVPREAQDGLTDADFPDTDFSSALKVVGRQLGFGSSDADLIAEFATLTVGRHISNLTDLTRPEQHQLYRTFYAISEMDNVESRKPFVRFVVDYNFAPSTRKATLDLIDEFLGAQTPQNPSDSSDDETYANEPEEATGDVSDAFPQQNELFAEPNA